MATRHSTSAAAPEREEDAFYTATGLTQEADIPTSDPYSHHDRTHEGTAGATQERFAPHKPGTDIDRRKAKPGLDKALLRRAGEVIGTFNVADVVEATIGVETLRGIILQLWESAAKSTTYHQEILAILESAIISVEFPSESQLGLFREAVIDLTNDRLAQAHVDAIRTRFIRGGFPPLAALRELEDHPAN